MTHTTPEAQQFNTYVEDLADRTFQHAEKHRSITPNEVPGWGSHSHLSNAMSATTDMIRAYGEICRLTGSYMTALSAWTVDAETRPSAEQSSEDVTQIEAALREGLAITTGITTALAYGLTQLNLMITAAAKGTPLVDAGLDGSTEGDIFDAAEEDCEDIAEDSQEILQAARARRHNQDTDFLPSEAHTQELTDFFAQATARLKTAFQE